MEDKATGYSDEELILKCRQGEREAAEELLNKYKELVRKRAKALFLIGGDKDDLIQEGMIGLYKAIWDYQLDRESSFYHFAEICISRQMYTAIKTSQTQKNRPLNDYVPFESIKDIKEDAIITLYEKEKNFKKIANPEHFVLDKQYTSVLEYELVRRLSDFERQVLSLYMKDYSYGRIAEMLGKDEKAVDNALSRVRNKLNDVLKDMSK